MTKQNVDLIISNVRAFLPQGLQSLNVICDQGKIVALTTNSDNFHAKRVLDGHNKVLLPGIIDSQVHFREPGLEHKETIDTGTRSALLGGVTSIVEMPNTSPPTTTTQALQDKLAIAERSAYCNYAFYAGAAADNIDQLAKLEQLPGCAGIKVFMGSSFGSLLVDDTKLLQDILSQCKRRIAIHAEDEQRLRERKHLAERAASVVAHPEWRDVTSALLATQKVVALAEKTNAKLHLLHISSAEEMAFLREQKSRLMPEQITVETLPQYLHFSAPSCYLKQGTRVQMNPPIRERYHQHAIWDAIHDGTVDVMATDHAPHTLAEKQQPYPQSPSGMPGVQTLLPVLLNQVQQGKLTLARLVQLVCEGPCRVLGIQNKGRIEIGYDADFALVDLTLEHTFTDDEMANRAGWTPYAGERVTGFPVATILAGKVVMENGQIIDSPQGQALKFSNQT